ncbi:hypothetical protein CCUG63695_01362 [Mycobacteroides franklinii]|uniref:Uncharacterized protein n=1 Tax=Mycobacteroides franklinii TaxID=948102 RepID=A0A4R8QZG3_9MYCO|nr:hypothetical protein BST24_02610 [Mycobacteroides franklinii]TDZ46541.1 hypothetical protein CCUG64054_00362 [Mycobacteroides franklinii]TDZ48050.1 hypothetical protein CCUG63697_04346 [Mycobacteroides franklinii]TDZ60259.1 hypothetical protein CCUG63696_00365 [Mycobacteroides franklinii]TDZ65658.1 hypothetical protein CCUG63695_01362 [Mycobacteroides franklinii]
MGFYDCNCLVTGVSLLYQDAALVILRRIGETFTPITLALHGTYDMQGTISADADAHSALVLEYFMDRYDDGSFIAADDTTRPEYRIPPTRDHIQSLVDVIERTTTCSEVNTSFGPGGGGHKPSTLLDGDFIVHALIAQPVWDAIARYNEAPWQSAEEQFSHVLHDSASRQIYGGQIADLTVRIDELARVDSFLVKYGMAWNPPGSTACRYPSTYSDHEDSDVRAWLDRARADYQGLPWMLAAIDACSSAFERRLRELDE